jgi:hypothetical protein
VGAVSVAQRVPRLAANALIPVSSSSSASQRGIRVGASQLVGLLKRNLAAKTTIPRLGRYLSSSFLFSSPPRGCFSVLMTWARFDSSVN